MDWPAKESVSAAMAGRADNIGIAREVIFEEMISLFEAGLDLAIRADRNEQITELASVSSDLHHLAASLMRLGARDSLPASPS